jgi:putative copper export protein
MAQRFSTLAGTALAIVLLSGIYNAWVQTRVASALWTTTYGRILLVKVCLALVVAGFGAVNRFAVLPGLAGTRPSGVIRRLMSHTAGLEPHALSGGLRVRLARYVAAEALLGLVVLACTAVLTESTPARHAIRIHHPQTMDDMADETGKAAPRGHDAR